MIRNETKTCNTCAETKPLSDFNVNRPDCRTCQLAWAKQYRDNNKDVIRATARRFREKQSQLPEGVKLGKKIRSVTNKVEDLEDSDLRELYQHVKQLEICIKDRLEEIQ